MSLSVVQLFQQLARNEFGFFAQLKTVAELMNPAVNRVDSEKTLGEAIGRREPMAIGSLAVVDSMKGDVIGLLKHSTILRCLPRYLNTLKEKDRDLSILQSNVCDLVCRKGISISPSASPLEALEMMVRHHTDCLLVYDDPHQLLGVIGPMEFARAMLLYYQVYQQPTQLQRLRLIDLDSKLSLDEIFCRGAQTARDVMSSPIAVSAADPVASAIRLMQDNDVWHLAMLDDQNQPTGVVSISDILMALQPPSRPQTMDHTHPLPPLVDLLADSHDPSLSEPVSNVARGRLISVSPTTRLTETLMRLMETGRDAVVVQDNQTLMGLVSLFDVARVFRTLMRLQALKND